MKKCGVGCTLILATCFLGCQSALSTAAQTDAERSSLGALKTLPYKSDMSKGIRKLMDDSKGTGSEVEENSSQRKKIYSPSGCKSKVAIKFKKANKCKICFVESPKLPKNCIIAGKKATYVPLPAGGTGTTKIGGVVLNSYVPKFSILDGIRGEKKVRFKKIKGKLVAATKYNDPKGQLKKGKKVVIMGVVRINGAFNACYIVYEQICK